jgi:hypothetical protein
LTGARPATHRIGCSGIGASGFKTGASALICADCSPADADRWRELKRHILRMLDGLGLAHIELESGAATEEMKRKALQHVRFGLGEETK